MTTHIDWTPWKVGDAVETEPNTPMLLSVEGRKIAKEGYYSISAKAWRDTIGADVHYVLAYAPMPPAYVPLPPPVAVGQVRVSPTGVRCEVVDRREPDAWYVRVHIDSDSFFGGRFYGANLSTWPIAEEGK